MDAAGSDVIGHLARVEELDQFNIGVEGGELFAKVSSDVGCGKREITDPVDGGDANRPFMRFRALARGANVNELARKVDAQRERREQHEAPDQQRKIKPKSSRHVLFYGGNCIKC